MNSILSTLISLAAQILEILIIVRVILGWTGQNTFNPLIVQVYKLTDPILRPFQNIIPTEKTGIDFSPIFALITISIIERFLRQLIF